MTVVSLDQLVKTAEEVVSGRPIASSVAGLAAMFAAQSEFWIDEEKTEQLDPIAVGYGVAIALTAVHRANPLIEMENRNGITPDDEN